MEEDNKIPFGVIQRILRAYVEGDVCKDGVEAIQEFLSYVVEHIAKASSNELEEINRYRKIQGLPKWKKIHDFVYINVLEGLYISITNYNDSKLGASNRNTSLSKADMEVV